eukprot:GHVN01029685.1.p1 GENE.GHVN01029685.1~~GHVN01029685.1.p1  ORF type:complete len:342 (-),score=34.12 GHVN01029685.1:359-1384(-)
MARLDRYPTAASLSGLAFERTLNGSSVVDESAHVDGSTPPALTLEAAELALENCKAVLKATRREKVRETLLGVTRQLLRFLGSHSASLKQQLEYQRGCYKRQCGPVDRALTAVNFRPVSKENKRFYEENIHPVEFQLSEVTRLLPQAARLHRDVLREASMVESRQMREASVCGVYNPSKGKVTWKTSFTGTLSGAYNPDKRAIEWFSNRHCCVACVWNESTRTMETKTAVKGQSIAGAFTPQTGTVEWRSSSGGICAVFNPTLLEVEFKELDNTSSELWGAYYDLSTAEVIWEIRPVSRSRRGSSSSLPRPSSSSNVKYSACTLWWDGSTYQTTQIQAVTN